MAADQARDNWSGELDVLAYAPQTFENWGSMAEILALHNMLEP